LYFDLIFSIYTFGFDNFGKDPKVNAKVITYLSIQKMKSLIFALLLNVIFVSSDSRDGIVHDLVDDFDVDEFDLDGLDPSFASASFNAGSEDFDQKDTKVDNDDDDDDEEEDEDNSWDDEDVQDLDDDSNDFGDDDEDDEFAAPKKKIKKKQIKKKNNKNKKIEKNKKNKRKKASTKSSKFTNPMLTSPRSYIGEYIAMVLIILYAMMYFIGSSQNEQRATSFMEAFYPVVRDQFHTVGEDRMLLTDNHTDLTKWEARKLLTKESQSQYRLYATGRKQVKGMIVDLKLVGKFFKQINNFEENECTCNILDLFDGLVFHRSFKTNPNSNYLPKKCIPIF
tara:strand:+ start:69 stop:1082 length:1014 start_codon:yes stop_codon:yes gene_type:complete